MIASANSWFSINKSYSFNSVSLFIFPLRFHTPPTVAQCPTNRCYHTVSELLSFIVKNILKIKVVGGDCLSGEDNKPSTKFISLAGLVNKFV